MKRPEEYRWNSIGYHAQTNNKENFLSFDFGLKEFAPVECASLSLRELHWASVKSKKEKIRRYRRYVYEVVAIEHSENDKAPEEYAALSQVNSTGQAKVIDQKIVEKERKKDYEITRIDRFRSRTRYFTDSGIIGSKDLKGINYRCFQIFIRHFFAKNRTPVFGS